MTILISKYLVIAESVHNFDSKFKRKYVAH